MYNFKVKKIKDNNKSTEKMIVSYNRMGYIPLMSLNNGEWILFGFKSELNVEGKDNE